MGQSFFSDVRVVDLSGEHRDYAIPKYIASKGTSEFNEVVVRGESSKPFEGRSRHIALAGHNAKGEDVIYVYGGVHGGPDMFCLSLGAVLEWQRIKTSGIRPPLLFSHCAVTIGHKIYVFGGVDEQSQCSSHVYVYDTLLSAWDRIDDAEGSPPPASPHYKMHAIGENLLIIGNISNGARKKHTNTQERLSIYMLNVQVGVSRQWCTLQTRGAQKTPYLNDMFETVALYDNANVLHEGPIGRRLQIMLFDGAMPSTKHKASKLSTSKLSLSPGLDSPKLWILEFADDVESSMDNLKYGIVPVPGSQHTPSLRVGQSLAALLPPSGSKGYSAAIGETYPKTPRVYVFAGSVYDSQKDSSHYTAELYMANIPPSLVWQVQCYNIFDHTHQCISSSRRANEDKDLDASFSHPKPSIGGASVGFPLTSSEGANPFSAALFLAGGLQTTIEDMRSHGSPGAAMRKSEGGSPAFIMLLSTMDSHWEPVQILPTSVSGIQGNAYAESLFYGGNRGVLHGLSLTVINDTKSSKSTISRQPLCRIAIFGGSVAENASTPVLSILEIDTNILAKDHKSGAWGKWYPVETSIPSRMGHVCVSSPASQSVVISGGWGRRTLQSEKSRFLNSSVVMRFRFPHSSKSQASTPYAVCQTKLIKHTAPTAGRSGHSITLIPPLTYDLLSHNISSWSRPGNVLCLMYGGVTKVGLSSDLIIFVCNSDNLKYSDSDKIGEETTENNWLQRLLTGGKSPGARFGHTAALLRDRDDISLATRLAIIGGSSKRGSRGSDSQGVWILDLVTMSWSSPMYRRSIDLGLRPYTIDTVLRGFIQEVEKLSEVFKLEIQNKKQSEQNKKSSSRKSSKYISKLKKVLNLCLLDRSGTCSSVLRAYAPLAALPGHAGHELCMSLNSLDVKSLKKALMQRGNEILFDSNLEEIESAPPMRPKSRFRGSAVEHPEGGILIFGGRGEDTADAWWLWRLMWDPRNDGNSYNDLLTSPTSWRGRSRSDSWSSIYSTDDDSSGFSKSTGGSGSSDGGAFFTG